MSEKALRVALFPDSLNEINGVANTCRHFADYARRHDLPMLVIHASTPQGESQQGSVRYVGLRRGGLSFPLEKDLRFDVAFGRYYAQVRDELRRFAPDVVHITGPSDVGMLGALVAHRMGIPVAASWHTNVHEYAARRTDRLLPSWLIGGVPRRRLLDGIEEASFRLAALYFQAGRFHFAPNPELIDRLHAATGKPCWLMERGVDLEFFSPSLRSRRQDGEFVIGYVGRLSTEKKIRSFAPLARAIKAAGHRHVRYIFVGHGSEEPWLRENITGARLPGVLRGEALHRAYADLDLFVFFSETDTFGNVVLEALASGVPALVSDKGGPKFIVEDGRCGVVCGNDRQFAEAALRLIEDPALYREMATAARQRAERASWDAVFDAVYQAYRRELAPKENAANAARFPHQLTSNA
jgi:glycosyltransferase involved in cell wall biosynthesis